MKKLLFTSLLIFVAQSIFSQTENAKFPNGDTAWKSFLNKNINQKIPLTNGAPEGEYVVVVMFMIDKKGNIVQPFTTTKHGYGMEEEVVRVFKTSPQWIPGKKNGELTDSYRKQSITFIVTAD